MRINPTNNLSFGINFIKNKEYKLVEDYAKNQGKSEYFIRAVNKLKKVKGGDIRIKLDEESKFVYGNSSVVNSSYDGQSLVETTYKAIIDLSHLDGRYKALVGILQY